MSTFRNLRLDPTLVVAALKLYNEWYAKNPNRLTPEEEKEYESYLRTAGSGPNRESRMAEYRQQLGRLHKRYADLVLSLLTEAERRRWSGLCGRPLVVD